MNLDELKNNLSSANNPNGPFIWEEPLPNELDKGLIDLIRDYINADNERRTFIDNSFNESHSSVFHLFSKQMAELSVRNKNKEYILFGLISLIIEGWKDDFRVNNSMMILLYNSAIKIGVDPNVIFKDATKLAVGSIKDKMINFLKKPDQKKALNSAMYIESEGEHGFIYKRNW